MKCQAFPALAGFTCQVASCRSIGLSAKANLHLAEKPSTALFSCSSMTSNLKPLANSSCSSQQSPLSTQWLPSSPSSPATMSSTSWSSVRTGPRGNPVSWSSSALLVLVRSLPDFLVSPHLVCFQTSNPSQSPSSWLASSSPSKSASARLPSNRRFKPMLRVGPGLKRGG